MTLFYWKFVALKCRVFSTFSCLQCTVMLKLNFVHFSLFIDTCCLGKITYLNCLWWHCFSVTCPCFLYGCGLLSNSAPNKVLNKYWNLSAYYNYSILMFSRNTRKHIISETVLCMCHYAWREEPHSWRIAVGTTFDSYRRPNCTVLMR